MKKLVLTILVLSIMFSGVAHAVVWLKQSTSVTLKFGPMLDVTDGVTAETALVNHAVHIELAKNGGNIAAKNDATTTAHDEDGYYDVVLNATDTDTLGVLRAMWTDPNALPVWQDFMVVTGNTWDSMFGSDKLQVDAVEISSDQVAADNLELMHDGTKVAVESVFNNAATVDAIWDKAMVDMAAGAPAFDASVLDALNWMYMMLRNRNVQTSSELRIYRDDGLEILSETNLSDNGSAYEKGEFRAEN